MSEDDVVKRAVEVLAPQMGAFNQTRAAERVVEKLVAAGLLATTAMRQLVDSMVAYAKRHGDITGKVDLAFTTASSPSRVGVAGDDGKPVWDALRAVLAEREASRPRPEWVAKQDDRGRWYAARQDGCTVLTYIYGLTEAQARAVVKALNELEP
jgi:hypothetical protein